MTGHKMTNPAAENDALRDRVQQLERENARLRRRARKPPIRKRSKTIWGSWPLYDIALGPDLARGELRGHARGIIAIGDVATGVVALGGIARGVVVLGGLAFGVVSLGGVCVGLLCGVGGVVLGGVAIGGVAIGGWTLGGVSVGILPHGGATIKIGLAKVARQVVTMQSWLRSFV